MMSKLCSSDSNECQIVPALCDTGCTNTPGSYTCTCNPGYTFDTTTKKCIGMSIPLGQFWFDLLIFYSVLMKIQNVQHYCEMLSKITYMYVLYVYQISMNVPRLLHCVTTLVPTHRGPTCAPATLVIVYKLTRRHVPVMLHYSSCHQCLYTILVDNYNEALRRQKPNKPTYIL